MVDYNILVKFPTRSRPELFLKTLEGYINTANDNSKIEYLISVDEDDESMTIDVLNRVKNLNVPNIHIEFGTSESKIHACNRGVEKASDWQILLLVSDDMHVQQVAWDTKIRNDMQRLCPDTDGCLWYHDGSHQKQISTLSCMGRKYYDRFGYIYHPSYKSFWCDNEYTEVAQRMGKITFIDNVIVKHNHPAWYADVKTDDLYRRNDTHWNHDIENYNKRKALNFPI
jgi:hypothetical protein